MKRLMLVMHLWRHKNYRLALLGFIICLLIVTIFRLSIHRMKPYHYATYVFGTEVNLTIITNNEAKARSASSQVFDRFAELHRTLHTWQPSEVMRLNTAIAQDQAFQTSPRLANMLRQARSISIQSHGIFDPGISALVALWGFQSERFNQHTPPPKEAVTALLNTPPSIQALIIDSNGGVTSNNPSVSIDFGGFAKGWALDEAATLLKTEGINHAMMDIGGDILVLGENMGQPWRVGIRHPRKSGILASITLSDGEAIATSGDYYRYFQTEAIRYSHIIDPRTGKPAQKSQSSTVLVARIPHAGATADATSKIPFIVGAKDTSRFIKKTGVNQVLLIDHQGVVWVTPEMQKRLKFYEPKPSIRIIP